MARGTPAPAKVHGTEHSSSAYGFVGWVATYVAYGCFMAWAFLPNAALEQAGVTYYPNKYWALALPAYLAVLLFCVVIGYISINLLNTAPLDSFDTLIGELVFLASFLVY